MVKVILPIRILKVDVLQLDEVGRVRLGVHDSKHLHDNPDHIQILDTENLQPLLWRLVIEPRIKPYKLY